MTLPFATIRQSMLNLFCNCQEAFRHRFIDGEIIPPAIAARVGSGVHKAAEANHQQKIDSGVDISVEEMESVASDTFRRLIEDEGVYFIGSSQELKKELGNGEDLSISLTRLYARQIAPTIQPVGAEVWMEAQHPALPIPFSGTLDVIDKKNVILDLKTASKKWRAGKEKETTQPALYKYMAQQTLKEGFEFGFHVMAYTGDTQYVPVESGLGGMSRVLAISKAMLNACETGVFMPAVPGHWICQPKWCGWYERCKVKG